MADIYTYKGRDIETLGEPELREALRHAYDEIRRGRELREQENEMEKLFRNTRHAIKRRAFFMGEVTL